MRRFLAIALIAAGTWSVSAPAQAGAEPVARPTVAKKSVNTAAWETKILKLTNKRRAKHGCVALKANKPLQRAARKHTKKMANADELSHQLAGEKTISGRAEEAGYGKNWRLLAENVAFGYTSPKTVVAAWMKSPGHRRNILNCAYRDLGVSVVIKRGTPWFTQDFGSKN